MDERRQESIRFNVDLKAEVLKLSDDSLSARIRDVSRNGLRLISDKFDYDIDSRVNMRIEKPSADSFIYLSARVIWKKAHSEADWKGYQYGLEFIHISRADREKLKLLLYNEITDHKFHDEPEPNWNASA